MAVALWRALSTPRGRVAADSPWTGIFCFYRRPSPEAEGFVALGERVDEETVVCIVEAMKVMNEIKAEMAGQVVEITAQNGEPVEYGQPLFTIKT